MKTMELYVYVIPLTLLHIGGGEGRYGFEETIALRRHGDRMVPFIPASTMKGVLRTAACYATLFLRDATCCWSKEPSEMEYVHNRVLQRVCDVCRIWGMPGREGRLFVTDFNVAEGYGLIVRLLHVEIDDYRKCVRRGALYSLDYVVPGTLFSGKLVLHVEKPLDIALVLSALYLTESVGLGRAGIARAYVARTSIDGRIINSSNEFVEMVKSIVEPYIEIEKLRELIEKLWMPREIDLVEELSKPRVWLW